MEKFIKLGLSDDIVRTLQEKGFTEPTQIQSAVIPLLLEQKKDVIGQAETGSGKTAAFALPMIQNLSKKGHIQAIVLTPTRELTVQVAKEIDSLKGKKNLKITTIYGGKSMSDQIRAIKSGVDIVIGTPGRIIDYLDRKILNISNLEYLILDEADEMLNMGFQEDVEKIMSFTNKDRSTLLFSATMPKRILDIVKKYMKDYELVSIKKETLTNNHIKQIYFEVPNKYKPEALFRTIDMYPDFYGIIFCRTKSDVDQLHSDLLLKNYRNEVLHGDVKQSQREKILEKFKRGDVKILIATDVAARGIDVNNLTHVVNYSIPQDPESYVHRIGRTGRAGREGTAITIISSSERRRLEFIERITKHKMSKISIPSIESVIKNKRLHVKETLAEILQNENDESYIKLAEEILYEKNAVSVVASILKYSFHHVLDEKKYVEIIEKDDSRDRGDRSGGYFRRRNRSDRRGSGGDRNRDRRGSDGDRGGGRNNRPRRR